MTIGSLPTTTPEVGAAVGVEAGAAAGAAVGAAVGASVGAAVGAAVGAEQSCASHQTPCETSPLQTSSVGKRPGLISQLCEPSASIRKQAPVPVQYSPKTEPGPWWTDLPSTFLQHLELVQGLSGLSASDSYSLDWLTSPSSAWSVAMSMSLVRQKQTAEVHLPCSSWGRLGLGG